MQRPSALTGELGRLERPGGGYSSELSATFDDPRLGGIANVPLLVKGQIDVADLLAGKKRTREQEEIAIRRAAERIMFGAEDLPTYGSIPEAVKAAGARSEALDVPLTPANDANLRQVLNQMGVNLDDLLTPYGGLD